MYIMHTFHSNRRDYNDWYTVPSIDTDIDPLKLKLFSQDQFKYNNDNDITISYSPVRDYEFHAGILVLQGNKTFGKTKKNKLYYKCIPNDKTLPIFLIPYELRIGFVKDHINKYVSFRFQNWDDKHPIGTLTETFGNVDNFSSFCSYQLWCNRLVHSIAKFNREIKVHSKQNPEEELIQNILQNEKYNIVDKRNDSVYTIDPEGSKDLDDGFSIIKLDNGKYKITIYIANVFILLDYLDMWSNLTDRVSTIYLPEDRRTVLPDLLSDNYCSLLENKERITFALEFEYDSNQNAIISDSICFFNAVVKITRNFVYEDDELLKNDDYQMLYTITKKMKSETIDSHDVVSHWMIYMNTVSAEKLVSFKTGVFRIVSKKEDNTDINVDNSSKQTIGLWNNVSGSYELYHDDLKTTHDILNVNSYVHVTSPIRRAVDIMNQIYFFKHIFSFELSDSCESYLSRFESKIEQINIDVKSIRRVQSECDLLYACKNDEEVLESEYDGYVFNKKYENNQFTYSVFLKSLNKISFFRSNDELDENCIRQFKLYLFDRENSGHRKIRLALV